MIKRRIRRKSPIDLAAKDEQRKAYNREYIKAWRKANPEKQAAIVERSKEYQKEYAKKRQIERHLQKHVKLLVDCNLNYLH
jgi:hypothetical protein